MLDESGSIEDTEIHPEDFGLTPYPFEDILGSTPNINAEAISNLLNGKKSAYREAVLLNSAAALLIAGKTENKKEAVDMARNSIDSGAAQNKLDILIKITSEV